MTPSTHKANRVTEYANALTAVPDASFSTSMKTDRWATASELLSRRDELLLAGWDETDHDSLPQLVRDLSRAAQGRTFMFPGEAGRLMRVLSALEQGQALPAHRCILSDAPEVWPALWRAVLAKLITTVPEEHRLQAPEGSALRSAQEVVRGLGSSAIVQEPTFRYVVTRSETAACEFVAASLATMVEKLADTVIYCEDDNVAVRLDACLQRIGLPTTGASSLSRAHPVLQILPLSLSLCWGPVDPQALLPVFSHCPSNRSSNESPPVSLNRLPKSRVSEAANGRKRSLKCATRTMTPRERSECDWTRGFCANGFREGASFPQK